MGGGTGTGTDLSRSVQRTEKLSLTDRLRFGDSKQFGDAHGVLLYGGRIIIEGNNDWEDGTLVVKIGSSTTVHSTHSGTVRDFPTAVNMYLGSRNYFICLVRHYDIGGRGGKPVIEGELYKTEDDACDE